MTASKRTPDDGAVQLAITFFYYRDLTTAARFYEQIMGFRLAIDQGWSKIYRIAGNAHVGLVDETKGMHKVQVEKPVLLCIRVADVDEWYDHCKSQEVSRLSDLFTNEEIGIRAFVFDDPGGYQIEVQSAIEAGVQ